MKMAQMLSEKGGEDPELGKKIGQIVELTGRSEDQALIALHDCSNDLHRAVERLLENEDAAEEWCEISKKSKKVQPVATVQPMPNRSTEKEGKKKPERNRGDHGKSESRSESAPRGRRTGAPPRFQRAAAAGRENEDEDNEKNRQYSRSRDRGFERGRGRGRGGGSATSGRGRGGSRGRGGNRGGGSSSRFDGGSQIDTWTNEQADVQPDTTIETWSAEDWGASAEDTKVFTVTPRDNVNSGSPPSKSFSSPSSNDHDSRNIFSASSIVETQVFTASSLTQPSVSPNLNDSTGYSHSQNNTIGQSPVRPGPISRNSFSQSSMPSNSSSQSSMMPSSVSQSSLGQSSLGQRLDLAMLLPKVAAEKNSQQQFRDSQFAKEATESIKNVVGIGSGNYNHNVFNESDYVNDTVRNSSQPSSGPLGLQNLHSKPQRSRIPPPSKIPASAVVMPGGNNMPLDVQFGNLDFTKGMSFGFGSTPDTSAGNATVNSSVQSVMDSLVQSQALLSQAAMSQPPSSVFPDTSTPPKDYPQSTPSQANKISSPPQPVPYPSGDRNQSAYNSQGSSQGSSSTTTVSQQLSALGSQSYQNSYQTPSYNKNTSLAGSTTASSYPQPNSLTSAEHSQQTQLQDHNQFSSGYQSSSFQTPTDYSSSQSGSQYAGNTSTTKPSLQNQNHESTSGYPSTTTSGYQTTTSRTHQSPSAGTPRNQNYSSRPEQDTNQTGTNSYQASGGNQSVAPSSVYQSVAHSTSPRAAYQRDNISSYGHSQNSNSTSSSYPQENPSQAAYQRDTTPSAEHTSHQRDNSAASAGYHHGYGSNNYQSSVPSQMSASTNLTDSFSKISTKDTSLDRSGSSFDDTSNSHAVTTLTAATSTTSTSLTAENLNIGAAALSLSDTSGIVNVTMASTTPVSSKSSLPATTSTAPPNLPPGVPLIPNYFQSIQPGLPYAFAGMPPTQTPIMYQMEDMQLLQQRMTMPATTLGAGRDLTATTGAAAGLGNPLAGYPGATTDGKLGRVDAQSPTNAMQNPQQQQQSQHQQQTPSAAQQQAYINAATLPPGYNYNYPSYMLPSGYPYTAAMFPQQMPSVTTPQRTTATAPYQKQATYGSHPYGTGTAQAQDLTKTYGAVSQSPSKGATVSVSLNSTVADLSGGASVYNKSHTQPHDKTGFHGGTPPPPFNMASLPSGVTQAGAMTGAPYTPPFVQMMHQPSQLLHHQLQQDTSGASSRSTHQVPSQVKASGNKAYSTTYWGAN